MPEPSITHHPAAGSTSGTFELTGGGKRLGYLEYSQPDAGTVCIDHVHVTPALRGRRMGDRLVGAAVEWARGRERKVTATCSFARAVLSALPNHQSRITNHR